MLKSDFLVDFSIDHSLIVASLCHLKEFLQGSRLWKFNKSLIKIEHYHEQMKMLMKSVLNNLDQDDIEDSQFHWE